MPPKSGGLRLVRHHCHRPRLANSRWAASSMCSAAQRCGGTARSEALARNKVLEEELHRARQAIGDLVAEQRVDRRDLLEAAAAYSTPK